jgi:hypothetical protein
VSTLFDDAAFTSRVTGQGSLTSRKDFSQRFNGHGVDACADGVNDTVLDLNGRRTVNEDSDSVRHTATPQELTAQSASPCVALSTFDCKQDVNSSACDNFSRVSA